MKGAAEIPRRIRIETKRFDSLLLQVENFRQSLYHEVCDSEHLDPE